MRKLLFFIFAFFLVLRVHGQCPGPAQRTALLNLQKAGIVESSRAGQIPLTDACGNLRYAQYTEVDLVPISYTPASTGNTQNYSEFVTTLSGDVWYIDWQGRAIKVWNNSGGGGGANDYDWLNIADNTIPDNIADSIYTGKYASVNMRRVWPNAQMLVGDSTGTNGASGIVAGDRSARWGFVRMLDSTWSSIGQEGTNNAIRLGPGTTAFKISVAAGPSPSQATAPFRDVASFRTDSLIRFNDYPNTRNDTATAVNFFYSDAQGYLKSGPVSEIQAPLLLSDRLTGNGTTTPLDLASQSASAGHLMYFNGTNWTKSTGSTNLILDQTANELAVSRSISANTASSGDGIYFRSGSNKFAGFQTLDFGGETYCFLGVNRYFTGSSWASHNSRAGSAFQMRNNSFTFFTWGAGLSGTSYLPAFTVGSNGYIGTGTISPAYEIDIANSISASRLSYGSTALESGISKTIGLWRTNTTNTKPTWCDGASMLPLATEKLIALKEDNISKPFLGALFGNSTIADYSGANGIHKYILTAVDSTVNPVINNKAVPGANIQAQNATFNADAQKANYDFIFVEVGLNNLDPAISTATEITALQTFMNDIIAQKKSTAKVILCTMTPCKQRLINVYGAVQGAISYQKWLDINTAIKTTITGADKILSRHTDALNDGNGNLRSEYNTGDGIHENNYAREIIGQFYRQELISLGFIYFRGQLKASATLDFPPTTGPLPETLTVTVPGAVMGDMAQVAPLTGWSTTSFLLSAIVTGVNQVTVQATNLSGISVDIPAQTYNIIVTKY